MTDINSASGLVGTHTPAAHRNSVLGRHSWTVLRDLRRPDDLGGRIDRIFVGPGGIVVVESARWLGEVAVERGALRLDGAVKDDAVEHAGMTAAHISALLPADLRTSVRAVVSLAYQSLAPTAVGPADVIGEAGLETWVLGLPARLDAQRADEAACLLLGLLVARTPDVSTSSALEAPRRTRSLKEPTELHLQMTTITPPSTGQVPVVPTFVTPASPRSDLGAPAWVVEQAAPSRARRASGVWPAVWFGAALVAFLNIDTLGRLFG